jgi:hypothetical protein
MSESFKYPGDELDLFQHAQHWKKYFSTVIKKYIHGNVLEVGAGIGSTTLLLNNGSFESWVMLEPDPDLYKLLLEKKTIFHAKTSIRHGSIQDINERFDTIIYIDVLEHIQTDRDEMERASQLLNPGGLLIILSPAFQHIYSPFDKAIGHFRRYTRKTLQQLLPPSMTNISCRYYDSVGYFASLMNKALLKQKRPSLNQVKFWDNWMIPLSRFTDTLFMHSFGKSIICIWKKIS